MKEPTQPSWWGRHALIIIILSLSLQANVLIDSLSSSESYHCLLRNENLSACKCRYVAMREPASEPAWILRFNEEVFSYWRESICQRLSLKLSMISTVSDGESQWMEWNEVIVSNYPQKFLEWLFSQKYPILSLSSALSII